MSKAKIMADFLTETFEGPANLSKGEEIFFLHALAVFLERAGVSYGVRSIDLKSSKTRMFVPGWEGESDLTAKVMALEIDGALYSSKGDFVNKEERLRIHNIYPVTKRELSDRSSQAKISHETRVVVVSYFNALSTQYLAWISIRSKPSHSLKALPL